MSTSLWILVVVGAILMLVIFVLLVQWNERRKLGDVQRFVEERNTDALIKYLGYWGLNKVQIRAAEALAELQEPASIPAFLQTWLDNSFTGEVREGIANALARMPGEHIVPLLLAKVEGGENAPALELLRRFDLPEARAFVARIDAERAERLAVLMRQLAGPSLAESLAASIARIHRETQEAFAALLKQVTPGLNDPLSIKDSVAPASNISWDNSEELREASKRTDDPATREDGIAKLKALSGTHQASSAPYALLAQAMEQSNQRAEAEQLLLGAIAKVHTKSEILDMLGSMSKNGGDYLKATAYYLVAAYAMNPHSTDWGTMAYLSGIYRAIGNEERAKECDEAAAEMRGGNRVDLTTETFAAIREAVQQHSILQDLANHAWPSICDNLGRLSGKYGKETWTPGPPPALASKVSEPIQDEAKAMLNDLEGGLDSLLRRANPALNVDTASMEEKVKAATLLAQSDSHFRNQFLAVLEATSNKAASISSALEEEPEFKQEGVEAAGDKHECAELPFERKKLELTWEEFAANKMTQPTAGSSELCLRCQLTAMAESILRLRPSSTSRFLREQPSLVEFTDGTAATVFELESGNSTDVFVDELFSGDYGDQKPIVINGIAVGASDKKATIDKLGVPQALSMGDVFTW